MAFYPDGEPKIPNQLPLPDANHHSTSTASSHNTAASNPVTGQPLDVRDHRTPAQISTQIFVRSAMLSGAVLIAAVLLVFVFEVVPVESNGMLVIAIAALISATITTRATFRAQKAQAAARGRVNTASAPTATDPYLPNSTAGVTPPVSTTGDLAMSVEDAFQITGRGVVVTGIVTTDSISTEQQVTHLRDGHLLGRYTIVAIEKFRNKSTTAHRGDNVGLLLDKNAQRTEFARGDELRIV